MKKKFAPVFVLALLILAGNAVANEAPGEEWSKTFGGPVSSFRSVQQTSDGGYIITGYTGGDVWLVKTDAAGNEEWSKTFGGLDADIGFSVQQTSDGGYIVAGSTSSFGAGYSDLWLIKTDAAGNEEWSKTFGGTSYDEGRSVQQTSDGGYIIVGTTYSYGPGLCNLWLIKTDAAGNEEWSKTFGLGGASSSGGYSVQQTSDGGYIIAGYIYSAVDADLWLIKTDAAGNEEWSKTFGGTGNDYGYSVQQTSDGGYIIVGKTTSYGAGGADLWLIKTDAAGNEEWSKTFGGSWGDTGYSVQQTSDGGYIIVGYTLSYDYDLWVIKTDSEGNEEWNKILGGSYDDMGYSVQQTSDGGYIIAGTTDGYGWLIKLEGLPTVEVETDKSEYTAGDVMEINITIKNPTEKMKSVYFLLRLDFPDQGLKKRIKVKRLNLTPGYERTFTKSITLGEYRRSFNASWYVALYNTTTLKLISEDTADWRYII